MSGADPDDKEKSVTKKQEKTAPGPQSFVLEKDQLDVFADASERGATDELVAFWRAAGDRLNFNPDTVEMIDAAFGSFKAWPAGTAPAGQLTDEDLSAAHEKSMDAMVQAAVLADFNPGALVFELRDLLLTMLRSQNQLMHQKNEGAQRDTAMNCEHISNVIVEKIAAAIASRGQTSIVAVCGKTTMADKITTSIEIKSFTPEETDRAILFLSHNFGKNISITRATADDFKVDGGPEPEIDADEPEIDFAAEENDDDDQG
jgi:hypothetical protein